MILFFCYQIHKIHLFEMPKTNFNQCLLKSNVCIIQIYHNRTTFTTVEIILIKYLLNLVLFRYCNIISNNLCSINGNFLTTFSIIIFLSIWQDLLRSFNHEWAFIRHCRILNGIIIYQIFPLKGQFETNSKITFISLKYLINEIIIH